MSACLTYLTQTHTKCGRGLRVGSMLLSFLALRRDLHSNEAPEVPNFSVLWPSAIYCHSPFGPIHAG